MAETRVGGNRGLSFTAQLDIEEALRNADKLENRYRELAKLAANSAGAGGSQPGSNAALNVAPLSAYRQAQLQMQQALADSRMEVQRLKQEQEQLRLQTEQLRNSQQAAKNQVEQLRIAEQELKNQFQQGRITQQQYNEAIAKNRVEQSALNTALTQGKVDAQNLKTQTAALALQQKQQAAATRQARQAMKEVSGSYYEAQEQLRKLGERIKSVEGGFNAQGRVQQARIREYRELNARLQEFDRNMGNHQRNVGNYRSVLNGLGSSIASIAAGYLSAAAVISTATATFNQSLKSDAVRTSLEFTFGSVDLADAKLKELQDTANRLGINYNALTDSYKSFTGAVIASNFDFQEGERIFNAVAGAASRLKLSSDDTEGALRALQQMISKGNVQAEELRGQLGERIPGAFSIAARAMGVTESQLNELLKKGEVLAADLLPKLATELENTFNTNTEEKVTGLSAAFQRLLNVFSGAVSESSNISAFFESVINGVTRTADSILGIVNSKSWEEFWARMFVNDEGATGNNIRSINEAFEGAQKTISKAFNFDAANAGSKQLVTNYEELRIAHKKASEALEVYKKGVAEGTLIEKGKTNIAGLTNSVDILYSKMVQAEKMLPKMEAPAPKGKSKAEIAAENKARREQEAAIKAQRSMQEKIDELTKRGVDKQLSADEQELESVRKKYAEMRKEAIAFNNDPNNKRRGLRVDAGGLTQAQDTEITALRSKQAVNDLKDQLDQERKLYENYEFYKDKLGKEKATVRFADRLKGEESYLDKLLRMEEEILSPQQSKGADSGGDVSVIDQARLKEIQARIAVEKDLEERKNAELYREAYEAAKTHAQAMLAIEEDYQRNVDALRKAGSLSAEQQAVLDKNKARALSEASVKELMDSDAWSNLFSNLDERTAKEIDVLLKQIEKQFSTLSVKFDPIDIEAVRAKLNTAREILIKDNPFKQVGISIKEIFSKGADEAGKSASEIKTDWKNLGQATEASFKFVEDAIASADFLKEAIGDVGATAISSLATVAAVSITVAAAIKTAEKASVILAIVQAALVVVQAIANVLGSIFARHDKKIEKSIQKHEDEVKRLGRAYNQLERDIQNAVGNQIEQAQKKQLDNIKMQQAELAKARDAEMSKKKKDQDKIDEYNEQIAQLGQNAIDVQNAINEALTGTTSKSIAESIIAGFKEGKRSAADFADTFKDMMTDAMYKAMSAQYLDEAIAGFYKKFISASDDGLSESELSGLQREWNNIIEKGSAIADNIDKVTGGVAGAATTPDALKSTRIVGEAITENTASRALGIWTAMYDINKRQLSSIEQTNILLMPIGKTLGDFFNIAKGNFELMVRIEQNTANTVNELKAAVTELKAINKNTGGRGRDIGV